MALRRGLWAYLAERAEILGLFSLARRVSGVVGATGETTCTPAVATYGRQDRHGTLCPNPDHPFLFLDGSRIDSATTSRQLTRGWLSLGPWL